MTIHTEHPFADAGGDRDPVRRLRGRLAGRVTLWTTGASADDPARTGLTVSSVMVAGGEPGEILGLVDPDSDLGADLEPGRRIAVSLLDWRHRQLADAFAGVSPAPGGPWRLSRWTGADRPPVPAGCSTYALAEVVDLTEVGWSLLVRATVTSVHVYTYADDEGALEEPDGSGGDGELIHHRGRYRRLAPPGGA